MRTIEQIATAAQNFSIAYNSTMLGLEPPGTIEEDLLVLEDTIRAYRGYEEIGEAVRLIRELYRNAIYTSSLELLDQAKRFLDAHGG